MTQSNREQMAGRLGKITLDRSFVARLEMMEYAKRRGTGDGRREERRKKEKGVEEKKNWGAGRRGGKRRGESGEERRGEKT